MPFSGKTTIGKLLAQKLDFKFVDLDFLIEQNEGMKISEIFKNKGEEYFRYLETKTLEEFNESEHFILSTGGGTIQKEENLQILKTLGSIFYLKINPNELFERIKDDKTRPLLQNDNPKLVLLNLYNKRKQNYERADFIIDAIKTPDEITNEIIKNYETTKR